MLSARQLVGLLAEPNRRLVVAAMLLGASEIDEISSKAGITTRETVDALDRLTTAGLVEAVPDGEYLLLAHAFGAAARAEADADELPPSAFSDEPPERRVLLDRWLGDGRLTGWPSKRSHRLVVLDHIAQRFEPGERYTERQVNAMLVEIDSDVATIRRYLVDEAILDRADGVYWRIGGTVPVP